MQASNRSEKEARIFSRVLYFLWRTIFRQKWPFLYVIANTQKFPVTGKCYYYSYSWKETLFCLVIEWKLPIGVLGECWFSSATALRDEKFSQTNELSISFVSTKKQHYLYCDGYWLLTRLVKTNLFITI